ncbi:MAG: hypothetical protein LBF22_07705 [Deltaproteobacteria bacterium]|jgi:hypothetical protein|nr:hypothetical protein [Deltaproteobacteria bacterium]
MTSSTILTQKALKRIKLRQPRETVLCLYFSLVVVTEIGAKLRVLMKKNGWNEECLIGQLEKIRLVISEDDKRLMNPLSKSQRHILEPFGLGETEVKKYIDKKI